MFHRLILVCTLVASSLFLSGQTTEDIVRTRSMIHDPSFMPFLDSLASEKMSEFKVPGAVVVIVTDTHIICSKAYGMADLEAEIEVDPSQTLFRIASITKLFTALATMQLYEDGIVDLHRPVTDYLPEINLPLHFPEPVTLHHLLTHTAGFDMTDIGDAAKVVEKIIPIKEMAAHHMPDQVLPPGQFFSYSNHGYMLTGHLISEVSGMSYEDYMTTRILQPLQMNSSSFAQPLPEHLRSRLAKGYEWKGNQVEKMRDYTNTLPGGGLLTTANDMSHFMQMILNHGRIDSTNIIDSTTLVTMTSQQFSGAGSKYGIGYGFQQGFRNYRRTLEHTGGQLGFVSLISFLPEEGLAIFIANNSRGYSGPFRNHVTSGVLDRLYGTTPTLTDTIHAPNDFDSRASQFTGTYKQVSYPRSSFEKIGTLLGFASFEMKVTDGEDGSLIMNGRPYVEIGPNRFQAWNRRSTHKYEFLVNEDQKVSHLVSGLSAYEKIPLYRSNLWTRVLLTLSFFLMITRVIGRPVRRAYYRRKTNRSSQELLFQQPDLGSKIQYWSAFGFIIFIAGLFALLTIYGGQLTDYGIPVVLKVLLLICTLSIVLGITLPFFQLRKWFTKDKNQFKGLGSSLTDLATVIFAVYMIYANCFGFQF